MKISGTITITRNGTTLTFDFDNVEDGLIFWSSTNGDTYWDGWVTPVKAFQELYEWANDEEEEIE